MCNFFSQEYFALKPNMLFFCVFLAGGTGMCGVLNLFQPSLQDLCLLWQNDSNRARVTGPGRCLNGSGLPEKKWVPRGFMPLQNLLGSSKPNVLPNTMQTPQHRRQPRLQPSLQQVRPIPVAPVEHVQSK